MKKADSRLVQLLGEVADTAPGPPPTIDELAKSDPARREARRRRVRVPVAAGVAGVVLAGSLVLLLQDRGDDAAAPDSKLPPVAVSGSRSTPYEELSDWASYGDAYAEFEVLSDRTLPLDEFEREIGEGLVNREVTIRIDSVLWSHRTAAEIPTEITMLVTPYLLDAEGLHHGTVDGALWLEVGERYAGLFVNWSPQEGWGTFSESVGPVGESGTVDLSDSNQTAAMEAIDGLSTREAAELIRDTPPDPIAEQHRDLPARERWQAVLESRRESADTTTPADGE